MGKGRLGASGVAAIVGLCALTLGVGLRGSGRLTYHEAIWAQSAREVIDAGAPLVPTLDGRPWLEKPPLGTWLIALAGGAAGGIDEWAARAPSAVAGTLVALAVATLAARRFGASAGLLAGLVQATTLWTVMRGRLAEADILLAALVSWALVALDRVRDGEKGWRWAFFALLGATALAKGVGFGGALALMVVVVVLTWDRDRPTLRALASPVGWGLAALLALSWPLWIVARHPEAWPLWTSHVAGRMAAGPSPFARESLGEYALSPFWQALPWAPLAMVGAWRSWGRARNERKGPDRLLWAWAIAPAALVSLARARNAHYLIYALPPWSIWSALALIRIGDRLRGRGWSGETLGRVTLGGFAAAGFAIAIGFAWLGPRFDRRGPEWAFYEEVGRVASPDEPVVFLYDDWDRLPYPSPFGPMPHDLAIRLYSLGRPASWRLDADDLARRPPALPCAIVARARDLPALRGLGRVVEVAAAPEPRWDRAFRLYRIGSNGLGQGVGPDLGLREAAADRQGHDDRRGDGDRDAQEEDAR